MPARSPGPYSSDGIPIEDGAKFQLRIRQTSGDPQTFPKIQFGVAQLEPEGTAHLLLPAPEGGWDVTSATINDCFDVPSPDDVTFKPDGTRMYVIGEAGETVYQYDLSVAWDITSHHISGDPDGAFSVSAQDPIPHAVAFNTDGTRMFVTGDQTRNIYQYDLSVAWDVTSAALSGSFDTQGMSPYGLAFKPDGTRMFNVDYTADAVYQYDLSVAWDVTSAALSGSFDVIDQDANSRGLAFKPDGFVMYMVGYEHRHVYQYDLSVAWDITSAPTFSSFDVGGSPSSVAFKPDGTRMFVTNNSLSVKRVCQYDL